MNRSEDAFQALLPVVVAFQASRTVFEAVKGSKEPSEELFGDLIHAKTIGRSTDALHLGKPDLAEGLP